MSGKRASHTYYETLALTVDGPIHGYDLGVKHEQHFGSIRQLAYGQLYASLKRLEAANLIEMAGGSTGPGPARTEFQITEAGRADLQEWLMHFEPSGPTEQLFRKVLTLPLAVAPEAALTVLDSYITQMEQLHDAALSQPTSKLAEARERFDRICRSDLLAWMREAREATFWR